MPQHSRWWVSQMPSLLLTLGASRNVPKWPCVSNSLCWGISTHYLFVTKELSARCDHESKCSAPFAGFTDLEEMAKLLLQTNQARRKEHTTVFLPVSVMKVHSGTSMASPAQKLHELRNQSPAPSGLRDSQIVLLPCGRGHSIQSLV